MNHYRIPELDVAALSSLGFSTMESGFPSFALRSRPASQDAKLIKTRSLS
jgi:hypothetical protein